jgi:hypothetical protein
MRVRASSSPLLNRQLALGSFQQKFQPRVRQPLAFERVKRELYYRRIHRGLKKTSEAGLK